MMVIGSFASYTKTKSVESAVWCLLTLDDDDDVEQAVVNRYWCIAGNLLYGYLNGIEIPEQGQVQNCYFSYQKQNSNENEAKVEQRITTDD